MVTGVSLLLALGVAVAVIRGGTGPNEPVGRPAPEITSDTWLNAPPQSIAKLKGRVVLVEFWTFGCYNCRNVEPHVKAWHDRYSASGLTVIGVHAPEFPHEAKLEALKKYVEENHIRYAVAVDNDLANWTRYDNQYWPAIYLIDKKGVVRHLKIGEGDYDDTERRIRELLGEAGS
ncbi:MAG TPA: redoxin domain-containing protein [Candidatus Polarisedimenticolia bacterium]|nr:redoxin domain-containing protein [Candidatus Polarisedimenticolia bacterium]